MERNIKANKTMQRLAFVTLALILLVGCVLANELQQNCATQYDGETKTYIPADGRSIEIFTHIEAEDDFVSFKVNGQFGELQEGFSSQWGNPLFEGQTIVIDGVSIGVHEVGYNEDNEEYVRFCYEFVDSSSYLIEEDLGDIQYLSSSATDRCGLFDNNPCDSYTAYYRYPYGGIDEIEATVEIYSVGFTNSEFVQSVYDELQDDNVRIEEQSWNGNSYYGFVREKEDIMDIAVVWYKGNKVITIMIENWNSDLVDDDIFEDLINPYLVKYPSDLDFEDVPQDDDCVKYYTCPNGKQVKQCWKASSTSEYDVNGDGKITSSDVEFLRKKIREFDFDGNGIFDDDDAEVNVNDYDGDGDVDYDDAIWLKLNVLDKYNFNEDDRLDEKDVAIITQHIGELLEVGCVCIENPASLCSPYIYVEEEPKPFVEADEEGLLFYFYSETCPHCQGMETEIKNFFELISEDVGFIKVNVIEDSDLAEKYEIRGVPTLLFIDKGGCQIKLEGRATTEEIFEWFDERASCSSYGESEKEPIEMPSGEELEKEITFVCHGCFVNEKCYPMGYRKGGEYCFEDGYFVEQSNAGEFCENNFECGSNLCINDECVSGNVWQKFLNWFKRLFG
ncbi:MAG: thioredoxin fold domain-containing protein [Nanoarchaeota archaeon]|nr:thioredoxin fold domain-containing protein [Nanoarchaeota archaeon]